MRRREIFESGVPILAICYGQQTLCEQLGGKVEGGHAAEFGRADVEILEIVRLVRRRVANGRAISGVDEPRRSRAAPARGIPRLAASKNGLTRRADETRRYTRPCSIPKSLIRLTAQIFREFLSQGRRRQRRLDNGRFP